MIQRPGSTVPVVTSPWQKHTINHVHWCRPTHDLTPDTSISKSLATSLVMAATALDVQKPFLLCCIRAQPGWNGEKSQHSMIRSELCSYRCYPVQAESSWSRYEWMWTSTSWPLLRFWGQKMTFMRISQFLALDIQPLSYFFIYIHVCGCLGLRWRLQLAGAEVRSGRSGGWSCIRSSRASPEVALM